MTGSAEAWAAGVETMAYRGRDPLEMLTAELASARPRWMARAACRGLGPDLFFGRHVRTAPRMCSACPVRAECLEQGQREAFGLWGGKRASGPEPAPTVTEVCSSSGCGRPLRSLGLCNRCYMQAYRSGSGSRP